MFVTINEEKEEEEAVKLKNSRSLVLLGLNYMVQTYMFFIY